MVSVKESRDDYVGVGFNYQNFVVGSTLTAIGIFLGGLSAGVAATLLTAANVVYIIQGGIGLIQEAIRTSKDAQYDYWGKRDGYVYDTTVWNQDVKVIWHEAIGTFDGGYLPNGDWAWIESPRSSAYNYSATSIADSTIYNYNMCILAYGYCQAYYPE